MTTLWLLIILTIGPEAQIQASVVGDWRQANPCYAERDRALKQLNVLAATCIPVSAELYSTLRGTTLRFGGR